MQHLLPRVVPGDKDGGRAAGRTIARGFYAGVALYSKCGKREARFAVCSESGPEVLPCDSLLGEAVSA